MKKKDFIIAAVIPILVGVLAAILTRGGMMAFEAMNKPPLTPPAWLFPVVWTILYAMMGIASYLVTVSGKDSLDIDEALLFYGLQLIFNFFWTIVFFGFGKYFAAFLVLAALWLLIFHTIRLFDPISKKAAYLMVPYLIWVTFAGYLNLGVWWLNR
jgi:tryptophan-rich sensory protein